VAVVLPSEEAESAEDMAGAEAIGTAKESAIEPLGSPFVRKHRNRGASVRVRVVVPRTGSMVVKAAGEAADRSHHYRGYTGFGVLGGTYMVAAVAEAVVAAAAAAAAAVAAGDDGVETVAADGIAEVAVGVVGHTLPGPCIDVLVPAHRVNVVDRQDCRCAVFSHCPNMAMGSHDPRNSGTRTQADADSFPLFVDRCLVGCTAERSTPLVVVEDAFYCE